MENQAPSMLKPALIAGAAFGIAGAIPVIEWINCACCALIIGCGFTAALLHSKQMKVAGLGFTAGNGAVVGLASGVVYGLVAGILGAMFDLMLGFADFDQIMDQMDGFGSMDPEAMEMMGRFMESTGPATIAVAGVFMSLFFGVIFASLGGLIGGAIFKAAPPQPEQAVSQQWPTDPPPPVPQDPPPPPPVEPGL